MNAAVDKATTARYSVANGDLQADRQQVLDVWRVGGFVENALGDGARYDWFYSGSPAGLGQLNLLRCEGESTVIGSLGVCPRQVTINGRVALAGVLVDFVVSPAHRTALPALQLQRAGRTRAHESMEILYGLPDTKAIPIFKRLGSQVQFALPSYTRVLRTARYLSRIISPPLARIAGFLIDKLDAIVLRARVLVARLQGVNTYGEWANDFDASFDQLWCDIPKTNVCMGVRDAAFLRWRFGRWPGFVCRTFAVRRRTTGELRAYFVCEIRDGEITIKDCLCSGTRREVVQALNLLCLAARRLDAHALYIHIVAPGCIGDALNRALFRQRSTRPFFASVKGSAAAPTTTWRWYITQADEDI